MTVLASPVGSGGYIMVARAPETIRQSERLLAS